MVELAAQHATTDAGLAGLAVVQAMGERISAGRARSLLETIGRGQDPVAEQARWLAAALNPDPDPDQAAPSGLVRGLSVLGPFEDTGGGLARREGPETPGETWGSPNATYAWGAYEVRWRTVPPAFVSARGAPLDLMIHPRKESCTYVASRISLKAPSPLVLAIAATGAVRAIWDGVDADQSEELHEGAIFDRLAFRVDAGAGDHLLAVKVCAGALDDDGRVRIRAMLPDGSPAPVKSSPLDAAMPTVGPAKAAPTRVVTLLGQTLDVGPKAARQRALIAGIVRTLGRADDMRSPRAPGLIDSVATDPNVSADALAMAGWISPFGAVRSGWLNRAVELALARGDADTASFAERRLAAARSNGHWHDWALDTMAREPLASDQDEEARVLAAATRAGMGVDSIRRLALSELLGIAERAGKGASVAIWDEIAMLANRLDTSLYARARSELASRTPEAYDGAWVRAQSALGGQAVEQAARKALATGGISSDQELLDVATTLVSAGRLKDAAELYERAIALCPNRAAAWHGYAETAWLRARPADTRPALARARALDPTESRYRAELAFRSRDDGKGAEAARATPTASSPPKADATTSTATDMPYLVEPSVFLNRQKQTPATKGEVADRQLHWIRVVTFHPDRRVSQLIQYAREVVIEPRTQEELYEAIPAEGDETEIVRARVFRASGGVAVAEEEKSEGGRAVIRWPDLKTGDVVEVVVRTWTSGPVGRRGDPPFYFIDYAGSVATHPLLYNEVVIDSPADKPLAVDVLHGRPDRSHEEVRGGHKIVQLIWDRPPNLPDEPFAPRPSEFLPTIIGSTFSSWKEFRDWYQSAVSGFTEADDQVRRLAEQLVRGKKSRQEKVKAIFEYVADDIRYVNYVSGEWWLPNRPQQLLARRQGDCDDKAILLITLLKAVGIEATEVLLQTRFTAQPSVLRSTKAAVPLFDHGIAYLPGPKGTPGEWLDATSPQSRPGPLPAMDARAQAHFVNEGAAEIVATPPGRPEEHGVDGTWVLKLQASGGGEVDAVEQHSGDHAFVLRTSLREKDARAQWVEQNLVAGWLPGIHVNKEVEFWPELPMGRARVHYRAASDGLARREGDEFVVPLAPVSTMTSQLAPLVHRTLPVVLPPNTAPSHQHRTIRILPPPGYRLADIPPGGDAQGGEFGSAKLEVLRDPKSADGVLVQRTMVFDMSTIPVDKYEAWRNWLQRVDALLHRSVRFVPTSAPGPRKPPSAAPGAAAERAQEPGAPRGENR